MHEKMEMRWGYLPQFCDVNYGIINSPQHNDVNHGTINPLRHNDVNHGTINSLQHNDVNHGTINSPQSVCRKQGSKSSGKYIDSFWAVRLFHGRGICRACVFISVLVLCLLGGLFAGRQEAAASRVELVNGSIVFPRGQVHNHSIEITGKIVQDQRIKRMAVGLARIQSAGKKTSGIAPIQSAGKKTAGIARTQSAGKKTAGIAPIQSVGRKTSGLAQVQGAKKKTTGTAKSQSTGKKKKITKSQSNGKKKKKANQSSSGKKKNKNKKNKNKNKKKKNTSSDNAGDGTSAPVPQEEVSAEDTAWYVDVETGYKIEIHDDASLLSVDEYQALGKKMKELIQYGSIGFFTTTKPSYSTALTAESFYGQYIRRSDGGEESGSIFLVDMANRMIYIYSEGEMYRVITKAYANTITDNVYKYARQGNFYLCAVTAFEQERMLLGGQGISQPMKMIGNIFLAVVVALFINWLLVWNYSRAKAPSSSELLSGVFEKHTLKHISRQFLSTTKKYSPRNSGRSYGGGRSGGGGGHHGGGGGHRF